MHTKEREKKGSIFCYIKKFLHLKKKENEIRANFGLGPLVGYSGHASGLAVDLLFLLARLVDLIPIVNSGKTFPCRGFSPEKTSQQFFLPLTLFFSCIYCLLSRFRGAAIESHTVVRLRRLTKMKSCVQLLPPTSSYVYNAI